MDSLEGLREFINERLTAAAAEIFTAVELKVVHCEEIVERQRRLLDVTFNPQIKLHRIDFLEHHDSRKEQLLEDQTNHCLEQEEPELLQIGDEPEAQKIKEEREPSYMTEKPDVQMIREEPEPSYMTEEPDVEKIREEPEPSEIREKPEPPQIRTKSDAQKIREVLESPQIFEEPEAQKISEEEQLIRLEEEHGEPEFSQTKEDNELCTSHNRERPVPPAEEQSYPSEGGEPDTEQFLARDSEVHDGKEYTDSESTINAEQKETSLLPSDLMDEGLVSEREVEHEETPVENVCKETELHQNLESLDTKNMCCKICGRSYKRKRFFLDHMKTHKSEKHTEGEKLPFGEKRELNASEKLKLYQRLGILSAEKKLKCEFCDNSFRKKSFLMAHMRVHKHECESKKPPCVETRCKNGAKVQVAKQTKMGKSCQKAKSSSHEKFVSCEVCGRTYTRSDTLLVHMRTHTGEKPYCCEVCGKKYSRRDGLAAHMRSHTGERPFSCDICGKRFSASCHLLLHKRIHSGEKPHSCKICTKSFSLCSHLIAHMRTHTGERPFQCQVCGKCFRGQSSVQVHMRTHTGERPFTCSVCSRSFTVQSHLMDHMRTHTGERPYVCELCAKAFSIHSNLVRHMKTHKDQASFL